MTNTGANFQKLQDIIAALRSPDGCPWDRKQTPRSFKSYLIEEAHELIEAIDADDPQLIREELGDMFFQLTFLGRLYEEQGLFTIADAIATISEKMIHRHPHVFTDQEVESEEAQRRLWNELKANEKDKKKDATDLISNVPKSLPALRRAQRVSERAAHNGFEWKNLDSVFSKLSEEIAEFRQAVENKDREAMEEELGDLLFVLVNLGRLTNINSEDALLAATAKFISRFNLLEQKLLKEGRNIRKTDPDELVRLWQEAKNQLT
jgi:MazG family protein